MEAPLIETKGLHKWYSGVHALRNVDFHVLLILGSFIIMREFSMNYSFFARPRNP